MKFDQLADLVLEMPITNFKLMGAEKDWESRGAYDKASYNDLKNPEFEGRVKAAFKGLDEFINIGFYFVNNKQASDEYSEAGEQGPSSTIWENIGVDYEDVNPEEEGISIVFLGNYGDSLVKMTPWVLAHRMGHVFKASRKNHGISECFKQIEEQLVMLINFIREDYGLRGDVKKFDSFGQDPVTLKILNQLGKFKSARDGKITRPYEFIYECFSQYLITGDLTFNSNFKTISVKFDEYEPEEKIKYNQSEETEYLDSYADGLIYLFDDIFRSSIGSVFVM